VGMEVWNLLPGSGAGNNGRHYGQAPARFVHPRGSKFGAGQESAGASGGDVNVYVGGVRRGGEKDQGSMHRILKQDTLLHCSETYPIRNHYK